MTYYTADTHLGHANIILYTGRPFLKPGDLTKEGKWISPEIAKTRCAVMDKTIIDNINQRVKENDTLIIDGDFCFSRSTEASEAPKRPFDYYRDQMKCKNVIIVQGNHDSNNLVKTNIQKLIIRQGGKRICIIHNPEHADIHYEINFTGHVHQLWKFKRIRIGMDFTDCINVGGDVWDFKPVTINEILSVYAKWQKEQK
jgi:calcineurin-like phosphoesterase family protein